MADIFISYARSTAPQAQKIAEALCALGYGVWRDDELPAHRSYSEVIEERLKAAKAVVVIWSAEGVKSEWVQSEADRARNDRKLVQLTVDGTALPMPFDRIQCADLTGWAGDLTAPGWRKVVASIADLVGGAAPAKVSAQSERAGISICVLPFANMSNDAEQEYFADGISEDIITDLSKVSSLGVISRNSAFTFKGKHVDLPEVARQLKVSHVLEGSVRKSGSRVRITAQLIDGATNNHVWAERYDRNLDDIFALQDEISEAIAGALKLKLLPEERKAIEDRGTKNVEAYDKFLRARSLYLMQGSTPLIRAAEIFREAIALDPDFALAWRGLYSTLLDSLVYTTSDPRQLTHALEEASAKIATLAPDAWWSHAMRADQLRQQHKWSEAEAAAKIALDLAPASEPDAVMAFAVLIASVGRIRDSIPYVQRLRELDPLSLYASMTVQAMLDNAGDDAGAEAEYARSKDLAGDREIVEVWALSRAIRNHMCASEIAQRKKAFAASEGVKFFGLHDLAEMMDQPQTLLRRLSEVQAEPANQDNTRQIKIAFWAGLYEDLELSSKALRRAVDLPGVRLAAIWTPLLSSTRKAPAFKAIMRDLGLYEYWRTSGHWGDFARPLGDDDFEIIK